MTSLTSKFFLSLLISSCLVLSVFSLNPLTDSQTIVCSDGNRFEYLSTFVLGRQSDLAITFSRITGTMHIGDITYKDELFRTYRIYNITHTLTALQSKQTAKLVAMNVLEIDGGAVRVTYKFNWQKKQLGSSLQGTGTGYVTSNAIKFQKTLQTNLTNELQWYLSQSQPIDITNGLTLSTVDPYKASDYEILIEMLNHLKNNGTTVKDNLLSSLNQNFQSVLKQVVSQDPTLKIPKNIEYTYLDYRQPLTINYNNSLIKSALTSDGLNLLLSQTITDYARFECGKVPDTPDMSVFGGLQQFISNNFLKSTVRYAIERGFLDVIITEEFWQSRAFQFFMGDIHQVILSTKTISSMQEITGRCNALNDSTFSFATKSSETYEVVVNFTCELNFTKTTRLISIILPVTYQIKPRLYSKYLDFEIVKISGTPQFIQYPNYKITNMDLANFMVAETLNTALGSKILGSNYPAKYRKHPNLWVKQTYLFLYDSSQKIDYEL